MTYTRPLFLLGVAGSTAFIATGLGSVIPWVASGPFALVFLGLAIAQVREYYQAEKSKPPPAGVLAKKEQETSPRVFKPRPQHQNQTSLPPPLDNVTVEPSIKPGTISLKNPKLRTVVTIPGNSDQRYPVLLSKGETLTAEAGADDWISLELLNTSETDKREAGKRYSAERGKEGKNLTITYEAPRNGNWFVYVINENKMALEVGLHSLWKLKLKDCVTYDGPH